MGQRTGQCAGGRVHFLVGLIVLGIFVWLLVVVPAFRAVVILLAVLVVGAVVWGISTTEKETEKRRTEQAVAERLATSAISLAFKTYSEPRADELI
jgi:uncharacterized membrane protein